MGERGGREPSWGAFVTVWARGEEGGLELHNQLDFLGFLFT